ncbi:MAG: hypothetical protein AAB512_03200 [Patescibacteria group bacterium]
MTNETLQPKKPELSITEINQQNKESYDYLRGLVNDDESPKRIGDELVLRFQKGGESDRGRSDKVRVAFNNGDSPVRAEVYSISEIGLVMFGMKSKPLMLSSGLQIEMSEFKEWEDSFGLLRNEDQGSRTAAKVIADTVRARIEAKASAEA